MSNNTMLQHINNQLQCGSSPFEIIESIKDTADLILMGKCPTGKGRQPIFDLIPG
jgi:hypothetical protein